MRQPWDEAPFMLDLRGTELMPEEREWLGHPAVGGIILFSRNYVDPAQIQALIGQIRQAAGRPVLIAVDQEGGRVQRFRSGFTRLPPVEAFGKLYRGDRETALEVAEAAGFLMAAELRLVGVDLSFAPVLDVDAGVSEVIGDRAFSSDPGEVAVLAGAYAKGMRRAGMAAVGKHFPGHGGVAADSHVTLPDDPRPLEQLRRRDLLPFRRLMDDGLEAVMCAHVVYSLVDTLPAGFSPVWLRQILRREMGFDGAVFSDDLAMEGAACVGDFQARAEAALEAGCDMLLACNCPDEGTLLLDTVRVGRDAGRGRRIAGLATGAAALTEADLRAARRRLEPLIERMNEEQNRRTP